jgi:hypothetical protein
MRAATFAVLVGLTPLVACKDRRPSYSTVRTPADTDYFAADSADSSLITPRLVTGPTMIVFWLPAADTLHPDDAAGALDDMNYYTERIGPALARWGVALLPTNADTVYVSLPNDRRRAVLLSGLDYPFGYLIAEPGGVERVLAGVYTDEELLEEVRVYFDLPEDTVAATTPKVIS